jgi:flagellar basal body P-ring formation protein FlgA
LFAAGPLAQAAVSLDAAQQPASQAVAPPGWGEMRTLLSTSASRLLPGARVEVIPGQLDARLRLAPCARIEPYLPAGAPAWGRTRVGLRCTDGSARWNVFLPVQVRVWAPALVAAQAMPTGTEVAAQAWRVAEVDWAEQPSAPVASQVLLAERRLARPLAAGQALRLADLLQRQWFAAGETVTVQVRGSGFLVSGEGQALSAGMEGGSVRVRVASGAVLSGTAVAARRVEVQL